MMIAVHLMLYISSSFVIYNMGFLQMNPAYECTTLNSNGTITAVPCSKDRICEIRDALANNMDPSVQA